MTVVKREAPLMLQIVRQRHGGDCTVACLAMVAGVSYEAALMAFGDPSVIESGAWISQLCRAADTLGHPLRVKRRWDWDEDFGILSMITPKRPGRGHVAVLWRGVILDTNDTLIEPETFIATEKARINALLVRR